MNQRSEEQPRELYTIPISSSWFNWDSIHDTERRSLPDFFDNSSYSRNPRVYKEYRDFIINKFREDPSRRLTFTEVRKSLIGDVGSIEKVFRFLDRWGLINFGLESGGVIKEPAAGSPAVVLEEGAPAGLKVIPAAASVAAVKGCGGGGAECGARLPSLSSHKDVFGEWMVRKGPVCGACGNQCNSGKVEYAKGGYALCSKCAGDGNNKEENSVHNSNADGSDNHVNIAWTDAETLLLLEAVLKHGDDWDLIAQHVRTKNKLECIAHLIHLPFGDHMLVPIRNKLESSRDWGNEVIKVHQPVVKEHSEIKEQSAKPVKAIGDGKTNDDGKKRVTEERSPACPTKKRCLPSLTDVTDTLTSEVALLSTVAGPDVAAAAAEAAIATLCHENPCAHEAFEIDEDDFANQFETCIKNETESDIKSEDQDAKRQRKKLAESPPEKSFGATTFRIRAAIAASFGAAAARAKLMADQELREMELLMASIIETQLKKINIKIKHFEELELIMEKEYSQIQQLKESMVEEWVGILERATHAGIPRWKDMGVPKLLLNTNL